MANMRFITQDFFLQNSDFPPFCINLLHGRKINIKLKKLRNNMIKSNNNLQSQFAIIY